MPTLETYIVIVNYNKKHLLDRALHTLLMDRNDPDSIILVDNASSDNSIEFIKEKYPAIQLIEIKKNAGWANATNIGIRRAMELGAQYVVLCNDDIEVYTPDVVNKLITNLKTHSDKKLYLISPRVHSVDNVEEIQNIGGNIIRGKKGKSISPFLEQTYYITKNLRTAECIMGAFLAVNLDLFKITELIDERMYLYMDETDLCYRAWKYGAMCAVDDSLILLHKGATSLGKKSPFQLYYKTRNEMYFIRKHFKSFNRPIQLFLMFIGIKLKSIVKIILQSNLKYKKTALVKAHVQGVFHGLSNKMGKVY